MQYEHNQTKALKKNNNKNEPDAFSLMSLL